MHACVGVWVYGCGGLWVYVCMGVGVYGCMGVWVYRCGGLWVYGCMGVWVYECVNKAHVRYVLLTSFMLNEQGTCQICIINQFHVVEESARIRGVQQLDGCWDHIDHD